MEKELNPKIKQIVLKFLEEQIYPNILDKDNLLGVVVYGSSTTGYIDKNSDVDVLILLNYADKTIRGVKHVEGQKIEYFIKPIEKFLSDAVKFTHSNCPSHIALNQNGIILYDRCDFVKNILNADNTFYTENHKSPKTNYDLQIVQISNRMASLRNILDRNGKEFNMVYYNILEMIRRLHSKRSGEADIPFVKAYKVYTDSKYYDRYVGKATGNLKPDTNFVKLYTTCIECNDSQVMYQNLEKLYNYEKSHYKIDPDNYEIELYDD